MNNEENEREEKREEELAKESIRENHHLHVRESDDMPSILRGRGPQENMAVGYDALEDL